jgi:hypothetical protein
VVRYLKHVRGGPELETDGAAIRYGGVEGPQSGICRKEDVSSVDLPVENHAGFVFCRRNTPLPKRFRGWVFGNDAPDLGCDAAPDPREPMSEQGKELLCRLRRVAELGQEPFVHGLSGRQHRERPDPSSLKGRMQGRSAVDR